MQDVIFVPKHQLVCSFINIRGFTLKQVADVANGSFHNMVEANNLTHTDSGSRLDIIVGLRGDIKSNRDAGFRLIQVSDVIYE